MSIDQLNEEFNDAFQVYFPDKEGKLAQWGRRAMGRCAVWGLRLRSFLFRGERRINERIAEYPLVFQWIKSQGRVLDIGCVSSRLPIQLASLGYEVHGLDGRAYEFTHPNFQFHRADLFRWEPAEKFDVIVLISVCEHFGLGGYGDKVLDEADKQAADRIYSWLNPGGQLLVTVPFGKAEVLPSFRVYDMERLKRVFGGFHWERQKYFTRKEGNWMPGDPLEMEKLPFQDWPVQGVAVLDLRKHPG